MTVHTNCFLRNEMPKPIYKMYLENEKILHCCLLESTCSPIYLDIVILFSEKISPDIPCELSACGR